MEKIQEMFELLNAKLQNFTESDEKVKSLKTSNKELKDELAEKSAKIEELEKAIDQGNLGQLSSAVTHSTSAVEHLAAANDAANAGNSKSGKKNVME
jgi:predicted RNase H-like nuclease (RuvC/YqgF family)